MWRITFLQRDSDSYKAILVCINIAKNEMIGKLKIVLEILQ